MKILLGISGGVDSAFAAKVLQLSGYEVEGAVLVMHEYTETDAAKAVAQNVGIKLHLIDCRAQFESIVKKNFVSEYINARTPNPCIICNEQIKFKYLYDYAMKCGFDYISTGHYARVEKVISNDSERYTLSRPKDTKKDQTYMLYRLPQSILSKLILPLSDFTKEEVRNKAEEFGILAANRKDSQEICFLPDGDYAQYVESAVGRSPKGDFLDAEGKVIGQHNGIIRYTVGQRKGLGVSLGERAFVTSINPQSNTVTLGTSYEGTMEIRLSEIVFSGMPEQENTVVSGLYAKIRYSSTSVPVMVKFGKTGEATLIFSTPQKAAPGQSAVIYKDGSVMFGGVIM